MRTTTTTWGARAAWLSLGLLAVANGILIVIGRRQPAGSGGDLLFDAIGILAGALFAAIGLLIVVRARNIVGWFLVAAGFAFTLEVFGSLYAAVGLVTHPGALPGPKIVAAIFQPMFIANFAALGFMLLLFPEGKPPSRRWWVVLWIGLGGFAISYVGLVVNPRPINPLGQLRFANPLGIESLGSVISTVLVGAAWVTVLAGVASFVGLIVRFRRGNAELRQQIKWLAFAASGALACLVATMFSLVACHCDDSAVGNVMFVIFFVILVLGVPASIAIAILKYRLFDIDVIISKAVLYGLVAAFFTAVYVAVVVGVGAAVGSRGNSFLTVAAAVLIAVAFQPVRERARHLANRIVYGKRATPYEVLSQFSERVAGTYSAEDVLPRMAQILASGTGAMTARVWLRFGNHLREAAAWPADGVGPPVEVAEDHADGFPSGEFGVEVRHHGELLGALSASMPPSDPINPAKEKLVRDLASQAGLVLRNVRLIEELRSSRRRIVTAQDERAKALERNIHDGAQQQLVALSVKQRLVEALLDRDPEKARNMLAEIQADTIDALENLRDLARGIYPPLLADKGLAAALEAQARKAPLPVRVEADGVVRYSAEIESAAYFCCLEALQNVAKYAAASRATVRLSNTEDGLTFEVTDDGLGFDPAATGMGTGLLGMSDRVEALGGSLSIRSAPGQGATVLARIPARPREEG